MGKRVDALVIADNIVFVIEFKVGESTYFRSNLDQVWDYALDLKNFHQPSHNALLVPILIATEAKHSFFEIVTTSHNDDLIFPVRVNKTDLKEAIENALNFFQGDILLNADQYCHGSYSPTPTIVEAALSLYNTHTVDEITRNDAEAKNLTKTYPPHQLHIASQTDYVY